MLLSFLSIQFGTNLSSSNAHCADQNNHQNVPNTELQAALPFPNPVTVSVTLVNSTGNVHSYKLRFTDISYMLVCYIKFRLCLPFAASVVKYASIKPIIGTDNEFILPEDVRLYPGRYFEADITVTDNELEPTVTVLDALTVLTTRKCPL
ncbi:hypothetical protein niasHT_039939 [Heterodera trifolii]|uniref:Uncharacterized protein n=1 Tax=Heterodera trifolii TaxID=157864 RepID=A0ABD2IG03_9BILA